MSDSLMRQQEDLRPLLLLETAVGSCRCLSWLLYKTSWQTAETLLAEWKLNLKKATFGGKFDISFCVTEWILWMLVFW